MSPFPTAPARRCRFAFSTLLLLAPSFAAAAPLTLDEAVRLAAAHAPTLAAQQAAITAADADAVRASQLPDPQLIVGIDSLPVSGPERFSLTDDAMTMSRFGLMQAFPHPAKRAARGAAARATVDVAAARRLATRHEVQAAAAAAWIDLHFARRERALLESLRPALDAQLATAQALHATGGGSAADVVAARAAQVELDDRLDASQRDIELAAATLRRWLGTAEAPAELAAPPDFATLPMAPAQLLGEVPRQAALQPWTAEANAAEAALAVARAEKKPDWSLEVAWGHRGPAWGDLLSLQVRIDLPLFTANRQDQSIRARLAEVDQREAERAEATRERREWTARTLATWNAADRRARRQVDELVPLAAQRTALALAAWRAGNGAIAPVLEARRAEIETRIAALAQQRERARAWAAIEHLALTEVQP